MRTPRKSVQTRIQYGALPYRKNGGARTEVVLVTSGETHRWIHERLGFLRVGTLQAVGFKFGRWVDSVLMQRTLTEAIATVDDHRSATSL
jgi:phosphinothricin acetyltransferase